MISKRDCPEEPIIEIYFKEQMNIEKYHSTLIIGNMRINNVKHFNWVQKLMWKVFFGIRIIDLERNDKDVS